MIRFSTALVLASSLSILPLTSFADAFSCPTPNQFKTQNGFDDAGVYASGHGVFHLIGSYVFSNGVSMPLEISSIDTMPLNLSARVVLDGINNAIHQNEGYIKLVNRDDNYCYYRVHASMFGQQRIYAMTAENSGAKQAPGQL